MIKLLKSFSRRRRCKRSAGLVVLRVVLMLGSCFKGWDVQMFIFDCWVFFYKKIFKHVLMHNHSPLQPPPLHVLMHVQMLRGVRVVDAQACDAARQALLPHPQPLSPPLHPQPLCTRKKTNMFTLLSLCLSATLSHAYLTTRQKMNTTASLTKCIGLDYR